ELLVLIFQLRFSRFNIQPLGFDLTLLLDKDHSCLGADAIHLIDDDQEDEKDYHRHDQEIPDTGFPPDQFRFSEQIAVLDFLFLRQEKHFPVARVDVEVLQKPVYINVYVFAGDRFYSRFEKIAKKVLLKWGLPVAVFRIDDRVAFSANRENILPLYPHSGVPGEFRKVDGKVDEAKRALPFFNSSEDVLTAGYVLDLEMCFSLLPNKFKVLLVSGSFYGYCP